MRPFRTNRLLAGTALAALIFIPDVAFATPDRIETARPLPPSVNGRPLRQRDEAPQPMRQRDAAPAPVAQPVAIQAEPEPEAAAPEKTFDPGSLDKSISVSDSAISARLKEMVAGKMLERRIDHAPERKAIESYYASRSYAPIWIRDGRLTGQAKSIITRMKNASADALEPADYTIADFASASTAEAAADADVKLTNAMLTYARHLSIGRIAPTRVTAEVDYGNKAPDPDDILKRVASARDADAALENYNPPQPEFRALKSKLAELRRRSGDDNANRIAAGEPIKPGTKDARVPELRERLGVAGKPGDTLYDKGLFNAIKAVQVRNDIKPTGIIENRTINAINGPKRSQIADTVAANMERWRWLPRDLGRTYVMVNIPDFTLKVSSNDKIVWRTKIVSGKPQTPTPLLTAAMDNVVVNPSWYIPQSIIQNELLPLYARDPQVFDRMGYEVKKGPDGHINVVQPPGAANALGRIKFNFPNKYQVYLHDTPEKRLFTAEKRAFSHGCMRVENPTKFGEVMLSLAMAGPTPSQPQLEKLVGQEKKIFKMTTKPMVHLTYQTAYVDDSGKLVLRDDIYGFDSRIRTIMNTDERRIADIAPPQDPKRDLATTQSNQEVLRRVERREAQNPLVFFERLFR